MNSFDPKAYLRSILIASILAMDTMAASNRSMPPGSALFSFSLLIVLSSWWIWKIRHRTGLPRTPLSLPFIAFLGAATISTAFSVDPRRSLDGLLAILAVIMIFFLICDLLLSAWKVEIFELALLIFVGFLLLQGVLKIGNWYFQWANIAVPGYPLFPLRYRLFGVTEHPNFFAMLIYLALPFAILRLARARKRLSQITWVVWLLLADIVFLFVDSRGGLIASIFVLAITIAWLLLQKGRPTRANLEIWLRSNMAVLVTTLIFVSIFLSLTIIIRSISPHTGVVRHGGGLAAGRLSFWKVAVEMFQNQPLTGGGPVTYARFYLQENASGIEGWIAAHAHNLYLDIAGQYGVLGLAALVWILMALPIRYLRNRSRINQDFLNSTQKHKDLAICALAGLTGFLIHSFVDVTIATPHTILPVIIVLAIGLYATNLIHKGEKLSSRLIPAAIMIVVAPILIILLFRQNKAHSLQIDSVNSSLEGRWADAARSIDLAIQIDPRQSFYDEQRAYAYGAMAMLSNEGSNEAALNTALDDYSVVLEAHPFWAPNYVNYAALLERNGEPEKALTILEMIPPRWLQVWSLPALMLAHRYEARGDLQSANEHYRIVLDQKPWVSDMAICRTSNLCRQAAANGAKDEISMIHQEALPYLEQGDPSRARETLDQVPYEGSPAIIWVDRAVASMIQEDYRQAGYELWVADQLGAVGKEETSSYFAWTMFEFFSRQGKDTQASAVLKFVGEPRIKYRLYDYLVFQRVGFPDPLLPTISILEKNKYDLLIYEELAKSYQEQGRLEEASWAREQAQTLAGYLDGIPSTSTSH